MTTPPKTPLKVKTKFVVLAGVVYIPAEDILETLGMLREAVFVDGEIPKVSIDQLTEWIKGMQASVEKTSE